MKYLLALLLAGCASSPIQQPPEFLRRDNSATMHFVESDNQRELICRLAGAPGGSFACANSTYMFAPNPCDYNNEFYASILCHELGHVNGWPAEHPE